MVVKGAAAEIMAHEILATDEPEAYRSGELGWPEPRAKIA
jgi:hypothetical protein